MLHVFCFCFSLILSFYLFHWEQYGLNLLSPKRGIANVVGCDVDDIDEMFEDEVVFGEGDDAFKVKPLDYDSPLHGPQIEQEVDSAFSALMSRLRANGWLFGLYQDQGMLDQHGTGEPYLEGEDDYPAREEDFPLSFPIWTYFYGGGQDLPERLGL